MKRIVAISILILTAVPAFFLINAGSETNRSAAELFPLSTFRNMLGDIADPNRELETRPGFSSSEAQADSYPASYDWRNHNAVTPVRNQGSCGSCWSFSAVAVMESLVKRIDSRSVDLSEQQVVNCVLSGGCEGGYTRDALAYMYSYGIVMEAQVPYEAADGTCNSSLQSSYYLNNYWSDYIGDKAMWTRVNDIKYALTNFGPVSVSMRVYSDFYYSYTSGVYMWDGTSEDLGGHAILTVGWVDDDSIATGGYWICKNSWGSSWGENGFFRIGYDQANIDHYVRYGAYSGGTNSPPIIQNVNDSYDGREGTILAFKVEALDPDGDNVTFGGLNLPEGATVNQTTGQFRWVPSYTSNGTYVIKVTASDQEATTSKAVTLTITNVKTITK